MIENSLQSAFHMIQEYDLMHKEDESIGVNRQSKSTASQVHTALVMTCFKKKKKKKKRTSLSFFEIKADWRKLLPRIKS